MNNTTSTNTFKAPAFIDDSNNDDSHGLKVEELPKSQQQIQLEELAKLVQQQQQTNQSPFLFPQTSENHAIPGPLTFEIGSHPETYSKKTLHTNGKSTAASNPVVEEAMEQPPSGTKAQKSSEDELRRELDELKRQNAELLQFVKSQNLQNSQKQQINPNSQKQQINPNSQKQQITINSQKQEEEPHSPIHPSPQLYLTNTQPPQQPPPSQSLQIVQFPPNLAFAIGKAQQELAVFKGNQIICSTSGCTHPAKMNGKCGTCINNEDRKSLKAHTQELQKLKYQEKHVQKIAKYKAITHVKKVQQQASMHQTMQKVLEVAKFTEEAQQLHQQLESANQQQYEALMSFFGYQQ